MKTSLTGIKPSGIPHLGNYFGAIRPALRLADEYQTLYFIADYHALTTVRDPVVFNRWIYDAAATWLACGLDPERTILFRQSAVPEVFELAWILSCLLATGQLERGHAFKEALAQGEAPNAGVFYYPVLMAADILLYDTDVVPIGQDQKQHLETARDVASRLNHIYGEGTVVVPDAMITEAAILPGLDGRKMSKSYSNVIPLFASEADTKALVMKLKTGSESLEDPKDPDSSYLFQIYQLVAPKEKADAMAQSLREGGYGWGHAKQELAAMIESEFSAMREQYYALRADEPILDHILSGGAQRARKIARETMSRVRQAIGITPPVLRKNRQTVRIAP